MWKLPKRISYTSVIANPLPLKWHLLGSQETPCWETHQNHFFISGKISEQTSLLDFHDPTPSGFSSYSDFQKPYFPLLTLHDPLQHWPVSSNIHTLLGPTLPPPCSTPATLCCRTSLPTPQREMLQTRLILLPSHQSHSASGGPTSYQFIQRGRPESHLRLFTFRYYLHSVTPHAM